VLGACGGEAAGGPDDPATNGGSGTGRSGGVEVPGLAVAPSDGGVAATLGRLERAAERSPASVVARVDHAAGAERVGRRLAPTALVLVGNPRLGTPLMQRNPLTGLDLPQDFLAWRADDGSTRLAYNTARYLSERYGLTGVRELSRVNDALRRLAASASGASAATVGATAGSVRRAEGIEMVESDAGVAETVRRIERLVEQQRPLSIAFRLDHARNARRVGMRLRPTVLLALANPALGTPLMQSARTVGIDLPQRVLVFEDAAGRTFVAYNDPRYLADRHGIEGRDDVIARVSTALGGLARTAAGASGG
jgi:uncharacterized protein (DUF302 family)